MNIGAPWPDLEEVESRVRGMQFGTNTGRAGCGESRTSGSEGGPQKPTRCETNRALRSDPTPTCPPLRVFVSECGGRRLEPPGGGLGHGEPSAYAAGARRP